MRFKEYELTGGPVRRAKIYYPVGLLFMYSPNVIRVEATDLAQSVEGLPVSFRISSSTGLAFTESRDFHSSAVELDISRLLQLLSPEVGEFFDRPLDKGAHFGASYRIDLTYKDANGTEHFLGEFTVDDGLEGVYGSIEPGETYGGTVHRRLWVNVPQTFYVRKASGKVGFTDPKLDAPLQTAGFSGYECPYLDIVASKLGSTIYDASPYINRRSLTTTWDKVLSEGDATAASTREIRITADYSKPGDGIYLRWINRQGETLYWLFRRSKETVKTGVRESFTVATPADRLAPNSYGRFHNPRRVEYSETRELTIGSDDVSAEEFAELCSLATSPVVEMLLSGSPAPSSMPAEPELKDRLFPPYRWMRVNIAPGTFSRSNKRETPGIYSIEFVVELPERHTARL